jgi:hypothetical protein
VLHDILPENLLKHGQIITDFLNGRIRVDVKHMDHVEGYTDDKGTPIFENNIIQFDKSRFTTRHCWVQELGTIEEFVDRAMTPYPDTYFGIQIGKHIFNRGTPSDHAIVVSNYDSVNKTMMIRNSWDEIPYEQPLWRLKMSCWSPTFCTTKKWGFLYNVFYIGPTFTPYRKEVKRLATCSILGTCAVVGAVGLGTYFAMNRGGTKRKKKRKCTRKL